MTFNRVTHHTTLGSCVANTILPTCIPPPLSNQSEYKQKLSERIGFEPMEPLAGLTTLAKSRFQPDSATVPETYVSSAKRFFKLRILSAFLPRFISALLCDFLVNARMLSASSSAICSLIFCIFLSFFILVNWRKLSDSNAGGR